MRRSTLALLRCPRCRAARLAADGDADRLRFGPVRCEACGAIYPVSEGILDLATEGDAPRSVAQRLLESKVAARSWERSIRPLLGALDAESEHVLLGALLGASAGQNVLDLSCGPGLHTSRLAHDLPTARVIGLDRSGPMLKEAAHHLQDARAQADLLRGDPAHLPVADRTMDAVLDMGSLHLHRDPGAVLRQIARVLRPGGRLVCATLLPERLRPLDRLEARAGLHRRDEAQLRALAEASGLVGFERVLLRPWIVFRAARAA